MIKLSGRIIPLHGDNATLASNNPQLLEGEVGIETDTKFIKVGDGQTGWNDLDAINAHKSINLLDPAKVAKTQASVTWTMLDEGQTWEVSSTVAYGGIKWTFPAAEVSNTILYISYTATGNSGPALNVTGKIGGATKYFSGRVINVPTLDTGSNLEVTLLTNNGSISGSTATATFTNVMAAKIPIYKWIKYGNLSDTDYLDYLIHAMQLGQNATISADINLSASSWPYSLAHGIHYKFDKLRNITFTFPDGNFEATLDVHFSTSAPHNITFPSDAIHIGDVPSYSSGEHWYFIINNKVINARKVLDT